jgi:hypothetical protein
MNSKLERKKVNFINQEALNNAVAIPPSTKIEIHESEKNKVNISLAEFCRRVMNGE